MKNIRREIHEYPKLAYEEFKTSSVIRRELDNSGKTKKHVAKISLSCFILF